MNKIAIPTKAFTKNNPTIRSKLCHPLFANLGNNASKSDTPNIVENANTRICTPTFKNAKTNNGIPSINENAKAQTAIPIFVDTVLGAI